MRRSLEEEMGTLGLRWFHVFRKLCSRFKLRGACCGTALIRARLSVHPAPIGTPGIGEDCTGGLAMLDTLGFVAWDTVREAPVTVGINFTLLLTRRSAVSNEISNARTRMVRLEPILVI